MAVSNLPIFDALKGRMAWLQKRQDVLAENVANADTPRFAARDLAPLAPSSYGGSGAKLRPARTDAAHMTLASTGSGEARLAKSGSFEVTASGNAVSLEEEMMKVAQTQLDYQLATGLYGRSVSLLKTALGRG